MKILTDIPLAQHTTFKTGGAARFFCIASSEEDVKEAASYAQEHDLRLFVLGGGSNILIGDRGFDGMVLKVELRGKAYAEPSDDTGAVVSAAAGEMWDDFVDETVSKGFYGLENLSAIPGTVGATPIQNIGAYGAEAAHTIVSVRALDTQTMEFVSLSNAECRFSYRDSMFKHEKGRYIITSVDFRLSRTPTPNLSYSDVTAYFSKKGLKDPTPEDVRRAVIDIRWNKLPDWKLWGTAGSFFKNPIVSAETFAELKKKYPQLPGYPEPDGRVKVSLGWILDKACNVKGLCVGHVCTYEKQALVLVSKPGGTSEEVVALAQELMKRVKDKTGLDIEGEVEWVN